VRQKVTEVLDENPITGAIEWDSLHWIILMGIEHEKIHLETSAVIIAQVPIELIKKKHNFHFPTYFDGKRNLSDQTPIPVQWNVADVENNSLVTIRGGTVHMGKDHLEQDLYGWDNEYGSEVKEIQTFEASKMLVSNAEYLEFVEDGGYTEKCKEFWSEEGWKFISDMHVSRPRFWLDNNKYRLMLREVSMPWNFPVEVSNLEAEAFCNWKSNKIGRPIRLISHEENFLMRQKVQCNQGNTNLNSYASPTPVNLYSGYIDGTEVFDVSGNVWRHSVSVLTLMNGFKTHPSYDDFTLPTIDGFHNHVLGGSWISLGNCANMNARYGFRRHFYQFAGIRYVCSENTYHNEVQREFKNMELGSFITEHYSNFEHQTLIDKQPVQNWPQTFGQMAAEYIHREPSKEINRNVLVVNGGPGRATIEILRNCRSLKIDHTDASANKLQVLETLLTDSKIQWNQKLEGSISQHHAFNIPEKYDALLSDMGNEVAYWQADYLNLKPQLKDYDIIAADCRHNNAKDSLLEVTSRLKLGGLLILGSVDDVDENQPGGKHSIQALRGFERVSPKSDSFAHIRPETRNKHQYTISYFSVWRKDAEQLSKTTVKTQSSSSEQMRAEDYYEDLDILSSYHRFHFGRGLLSVKNFMERMSEVCVDAGRKYGIEFNAALDAGCGPGRCALEMCKAFRKVFAYDYCPSFVRMLETEKSHRSIDNLEAVQGDANRQDELFPNRKFDLIVGCNLIDRLSTPKKWILQSKEMLSANGVLIIASPYTWMKEYTPEESWVGGFKKDGENFYTVDGLQLLLGPELVLKEEERVPFVIPDADGTFQYTYSNCTIFAHAQ